MMTKRGRVNSLFADIITEYVISKNITGIIKC